MSQIFVAGTLSRTNEEGQEDIDCVYAARRLVNGAMAP